jgi:hypothetical protein
MTFDLLFMLEVNELRQRGEENRKETKRTLIKQGLGAFLNPLSACPHEI